MRLISGYSLFFAIGLIRADTSNEVTATSNAPPSFRYKTDQVGFFVQEDGLATRNITSYVSSNSELLLVSRFSLLLAMSSLTSG